jgi:hypothetical protein
MVAQLAAEAFGYVSRSIIIEILLLIASVEA